MDWFLYDNGLSYDRVKQQESVFQYAQDNFNVKYEI